MRLKSALLAMSIVNLIGPRVVLGADAEVGQADALQEIIVTAEKRESSAQKTPVSMNVYDTSEIAEKAIVNMQSLTQADPSLVFNRNGGEATLAIRGVTTNNTTELGNPAVPVGVDNFFVNRAAALDSALFDVERIEVLLGPQGTLFGRSAIGGVVNITTIKPGKEFEAGGSVEFGNYNAINGTGYVNLPLNDWMQVRAAFISRRHEGYRASTYVNPGQQPDRADDEDTRAGRVTLKVEPLDGLEGWVSYQQSYQGGSGPAILSIPWVTLANGDISHDKIPLGDPSAFPLYGTPWQRINDKTTKWNVAYSNLPFGMTVTYLGGFDTYDWRHSTSSFSYFQGVVPDPADPTNTNIFLPIRPFVQSEAPRTQNHELRLTSAPTGLVTWQAGLYYFNEKNSLQSEAIANPGSEIAVPLLTFVYSVKTTAKAGYAQGALHFTDEQAVSVGVRYSKDDISRDGLFGLPVFGIPPSPNGVGTYSDSKVTWHLGYDYNWTDRNLLYAKVDTGYKPGGFDSCSQFKPENVTTGEVGSKNRWASDRMQWNAAIYYSDYKDQQITQFTAACPTGSVTTNAGKSRIYGLETDFKALVENVGTFDLGINYLHATYTNIQLPPNNGAAGLVSCAHDALGNCTDLDGNDMVQSPRFTAALGYDRVFGLPSGDVDFRIEGRYTTKQYFDPFNHADTEQPGYMMLNSYLSYKHDNWSVGLFGRNLTNKAYLNYGQEQATGGATQYSYSYGDPRVFGVRFEAHTK